MSVKQRMRSGFLLIGVLLQALAIGCSGGAPGGYWADGGPIADGGSVADGGPAVDGGPTADGGIAADGGLEMDGGPAVDGGPTADGGTVPLAGFGDIQGACGVLDDEEWNAQAPFVFRNAIDFHNLSFHESVLSSGGLEVYNDGNLGGTSLHSEIFSFEVLYRCELATLLKTEKEIDYLNVQGKKTDLLVSIDGRKVGVSVTRGYHFPPTNPYTVQEAKNLLTGKLSDVLLSAANADPADAWSRSILHVIAYDSQYADALQLAYNTLDAATKAETILLITVTDGNDAIIY